MTKPVPDSDMVFPPVRPTLPDVEIFPLFSVTLRPAVTLTLPEVLATLALMRTSLEAPVEASVTWPEPFAVTADPIVSVPPVAVRLMLPWPTVVVIAPEVLRAPVLVIVIASFPVPVLLTPVRVRGFAVSVRLMLPEVEFVPLKTATVLAPFKVCPVAELVVRVPGVLMRPAPDSVMVPVEVRLAPASAMVPVMLMAPVLLMVSVPTSLTPVRVRGFAVFVREMVPEVVFVPLKAATVLAPFKV